MSASLHSTWSDQITWQPHGTRPSPRIDVALLSGAVSHEEPTGAVVSIFLATSTAPAAFTCPTPWDRCERPVESGSPSAPFSLSGMAVYSMIAFTVLGQSDGLAFRTRAATPATSGAAMLVPERTK